MKPVCVPCERFYRPKKNGFAFTEGMPKEGNPRAGLAEPDRWQPYKLWMGDLWECPDCGHQIISGVGHTPLAEHYEDNFSTRQKSFGAEQLLVKDC